MFGGGGGGGGRPCGGGPAVLVSFAGNLSFLSNVYNRSLVENLCIFVEKCTCNRAVTPALSCLSYSRLLVSVAPPMCVCVSMSVCTW